ncbi:MAG: hypothetical protein ACOCVI_00695 [Planctomycetota bacterium]
MPAPWNGWYHGVLCTYGTWLRGDRRGFRTRHHREHVEGDYRNPPPAGLYEALAQESAKSLRFPPAKLTPEACRAVCHAFAVAMLKYHAELVDLVVCPCHAHLLARFPDHLHSAPANLLTDGRNPIPRHIAGRAKRAASLALTRRSLKQKGRPLWAKRGKLQPIRDQKHFEATIRYIQRHQQGGGVLWSRLKESDV